MTADLSHIAEQLRALAVPIAGLVLDPANARTHPIANLEAIKGSLAVYGQRKPIVVNRRTNVVEAGNGTLVAARDLGWTHLAAVYVDDDPNAAAGFSIADNQSALLAGWDKEALDKVLRQIDTNDDRLRGMLDDLAKDQGIQLGPDPPQDPGPQLDQAEALQKKWGTALGQIWVAESKSAPPRKVVKCPHCDCEQEVE
jgi:hypothetical protein